jgi:uncharacterized protein (TIGR02452 family)
MEVETTTTKETEQETNIRQNIKIADDNKQEILNDISQYDYTSSGFTSIPVTCSLATSANIDHYISQGTNYFDLYRGTTIDAVLYLKHKYPSAEIAILNFANGITPGGGYLEGVTAQEEDLCRKSPYLYYSLYLAKMGGLYDLWSKGLKKYQDDQVKWDSQILYTPNVKFIRDAQNKILQNPYKVSVISAVAPFSQKITDSSQITQLVPKIKNVIKYIYYAPILAETRSTYFHCPSNTSTSEIASSANKPVTIGILILGAWGCGNFAPTNENLQKSYRQQVAQCFVDVLKKNGGHYNLICFAIPNDDNYSIFGQIFMDNNLIGYKHIGYKHIGGKNYYYKYQKYKHKYNALKKLSNGMNPR